MSLSRANLAKDQHGNGDFGQLVRSVLLACPGKGASSLITTLLMSPDYNEYY